MSDVRQPRLPCPFSLPHHCVHVTTLGCFVSNALTCTSAPPSQPPPQLPPPPSESPLPQQEGDASPPEYLSRLEHMVAGDKSMLPVDYAHLASHDPELAQAVEAHYYRVDKFLRLGLRQAVEATMGAVGAEYLNRLHEKRTVLSVGFQNFPRVVNIRMMRADRIGRLSAVAGRAGGRDSGRGRGQDKPCMEGTREEGREMPSGKGV